MSESRRIDLFEYIALDAYIQAFDHIICNVDGDYEVKGETGGFEKCVFVAGMPYPARGLRKVQKYGGADLEAGEITGVQ